MSAVALGGMGASQSNKASAPPKENSLRVMILYVLVREKRSNGATAKSDRVEALGESPERATPGAKAILLRMLTLH